MIIKSMTRKTPTWGQLLDYMVKGSERYRDPDGMSFILKHNIWGHSIKEWTKSFEETEKRRVNTRTNNVKVFHEILSWSNKDTSKLTLEKMKDMATAYIKVRNENASFIAVPHRDKDHFHIHFCISAVEAKTGKSIRVSREEFKNIKEKIQQYQVQRYPELSNSVVNHSKESKRSIKESEFQLKKRGGQLTEKGKVKQQLDSIFKSAISKEDFYSKVKEQGLNIYERSGKIAGIEGERNMRFSTLGYPENRLSDLDSYQDRMKGLIEVREANELDKGNELYEPRDLQEMRDDYKPNEPNDKVEEQENIEEYQDENREDLSD
jgi:hypothetical protein